MSANDGLASGPSASPARRAPISIFGLLALIFLTVSGGPYGLEPMVSSVGGRATLILLILVPLVWSLPIALMVAELASMLPLLGGYYRWVREAMGEFWGFQEGWWSWLFTWVDMPLYPALCGEILREGWPLLTGRSLSNAGTLAFVLGFIWLAALLNLRGAKFISRYAIVTSLAVLAPFVVFVAVAWRHAPIAPAPPHHPLALAGWGVGLSTVMWNYAGWDNVATFAPDVDRPSRNYPLALVIGVLLIALIYIVPVVAGLHLDPVRAHWQNGYFVRLAAMALGPRLAPAVALIMMITALISAWAQYTGQLLYVVPLPLSLAQDGYLPASLLERNRHDVAWRALLLCSVLYSVFAWASFAHLLAADVLLYSAALALEFVALWMLRRRRPPLAAPFRIPLPGWRLLPLCCAPLGLAAAMFILAVEQERGFTLIALAMLASGPVIYWALTLWRRTRPPEVVYAESA